MVQVRNNISRLKWLVSKAARIILCFCYVHKQTQWQISKGVNDILGMLHRSRAFFIHTHTRARAHAHTITQPSHTNIQTQHCRFLVQNFIMEDVTQVVSWSPPPPTPPCPHVCRQTHTHTHTHTHIRTHTHTHIHTHIHIRTHIHARTHTHTHTHRHNVLWCIAYALSFRKSLITLSNTLSYISNI